MDATGLILFTMIPAMALTMLNLGIGPFAHPKFIGQHKKFRALPAVVRHVVQLICVLVLMTGAAQMLGVIEFTAPPLDTK